VRDRRFEFEQKNQHHKLRNELRVNMQSRQFLTWGNSLQALFKPWSQREWASVRPTEVEKLLQRWKAHEDDLDCRCDSSYFVHWV
jgi:hypothetical protein